MDLNIRNTDNIKEVAEFISASILRQLTMNKRVLLLLSGGSAIPMEVELSKILKSSPLNNLVVTLVDERYGEINNPDSNWFKLIEAGFDLPEAKMIPYLSGELFTKTITKIRQDLKEELKRADYKIAILGLGIDGHTAGILPHTEAVNSQEDVCFYETNTYDRMTITPHIISTLDEVVVFAFGEDKRAIIDSMEKDIPIDDQPAQILKKVPLLTIFTDYNVK